MPNWREGGRYQHHHYHWRLIPPIWGKVYELTFPLDHILGLFGCGFYYWLWISWAVGSMLYIFHGHLWMQIPHLWNLQFFLWCSKGEKGVRAHLLWKRSQVWFFSLDFKILKTAVLFQIFFTDNLCAKHWISPYLRKTLNFLWKCHRLNMP